MDTILLLSSDQTVEHLPSARDLRMDRTSVQLPPLDRSIYRGLLFSLLLAAFIWTVVGIAVWWLTR